METTTTTKTLTDSETAAMLIANDPFAGMEQTDMVLVRLVGRIEDALAAAFDLPSDDGLDLDAAFAF